MIVPLYLDNSASNHQHENYSSAAKYWGWWEVVFEDIPSSRYQKLITTMNFPNQVSTFAQMMEKNLNRKHCDCNSTCWRDWWTRALIRFQRDLAIELTMFAKHTALSKLLMKWKSLPKGKACSCASLAHKCKCRYVTGSKCNKTDEKWKAHKMLCYSPKLPFPTILHPTKAPKRPPITNTPFGNWKL